MLRESRETVATYLNNLVLEGVVKQDKGREMFDRINTFDMQQCTALHQALIMKEFATSKVIDEIKHAVLLAKTKGELNCFLDLTRSDNPMLTKVQVDTFISVNKILGE